MDKVKLSRFICSGGQARGWLFTAGLAVLLVFVLLGGRAPAEAVQGNSLKPPDLAKIPVLMYHEVLPFVVDNEVTNTSVLALSTFSRQLEYLNKNGFKTASMAELEDHVRQIKPLPPKTVAITFDDGYESNYLYCFPLLAEYSMKATLFLMGSVPEKARPHLTGMQVKNMIASGFMEIGCHTYDCHRLVDGKPALKMLSGTQIKNDFAYFRHLLELIDVPRPVSIAYPYGEAGPTAVDVAVAEGYRLGFTTETGYVRAGDRNMYLKRFSVGPETSMETFIEIVSGSYSENASY